MIDHLPFTTADGIFVRNGDGHIFMYGSHRAMSRMLTIRGVVNGVIDSCVFRSLEGFAGPYLINIASGDFLITNCMFHADHVKDSIIQITQ